MNLDILSNTFLNSRKRTVQIDRPIYREDDLHLCYEDGKKNKPSFTSNVSTKLQNCCTSVNFLALLVSIFPVISWIPKYKLGTDLVRDLAAGLTLGIIQIPQGKSLICLFICIFYLSIFCVYSLL